MRQLEAIGWREWVYLPDFADAPPLKTKIDTGARSSVIDTTRIQLKEIEGDHEIKFRVAFRLQFEQKRDVSFVDYELPASLSKVVRSSSGETELRPFVQLPIQIGNQTWTIEASLTDRGEMINRMLLGRTAVKNRFLVNPAKTFLFGKFATK